MADLTIGVLRESATGESRVAIVPEVVPRLTALGAAVLIESGAGSAAHFTDDAYAAAGAEMADADAVHARSDVLLRVGTAGAGGRGAHAGRHPARRAAPAVRTSRRDQQLGRRRSDHRVPGSVAAHPVPGPDDGRAHLPGQRRRLPGGDQGRGGLPGLVPDADDRGRHGQAGRGVGARYRGRRAAGDRHRAPAGCHGCRPTTSGRPAATRSSRWAPGSSTCPGCSPTAPAPAATPANSPRRSSRPSSAPWTR